MQADKDLDNLIAIKELFLNWAGEECISIEQLPGSGSERVYFRLQSTTKSAIVVLHPNPKETNAFVAFTRHFYKLGLAVPNLYKTDLEHNIYLLEDLGNSDLYSIVTKRDNFDEELFELYSRVLKDLVDFQVKGGAGLDYSLAYPRIAFDRQSMQWDLNYFKYNFLKIAGVQFYEQALEDDFNSLMDFLLTAPSGYFMYRDFQSRNIMLKKGKPFYIDYQGGRKGPLQYDVASLLFQVKADIPFETREKLLNGYLENLNHVEVHAAETFRQTYFGFVLLRLLQVMGAYGFRGLHERKQHFIDSIPFAIKNIAWWLQNVNLPIELPELKSCLLQLTESEQFKSDVRPTEKAKLTVGINSFSYKKGIPEDYSGNGGGFVFDCRALPNPGREEQYRKYTGKDEIIINYLKQHNEVDIFLQNAYHIIDQCIINYLERGFNNLMVNFGCTGGQHRSVYCAENLFRHLNKKFNIEVIIQHTQADNWPGK